jgi:CubicO group peptidase (beta-lactamase class C family)
LSGELGRLIAQAGFAPTTPVVIALCHRDGEVVAAAAGSWPQGRPAATSDLFYTASLAKQVTGASAALLVRSGELDPDAPVSHYLPELPAWAAAITPRHMAHHLAGLPEATVLEKQLGRWTTDRVLAALCDMPVLPHPPGAAHVYSNVGYVLLAQIVERVSARTLANFVGERMLRPHGVSGMHYVMVLDPSPLQMQLLGPSPPLSVGDGGLWSTAPAFARWLHLMNRDAFGIEGIVTSAGITHGGGRVDYGWGIGLALRSGQPFYFHGGSWPGAVARAVRLPKLGVGIVAMAASDDAEHLTGLVDAALAAIGHS